MSKIEIKGDEGNYEWRAYGFTLADDLYMFFRFESPKSDCEIGIAYDEFVNGGDWYCNDGYIDYDADQDIIEDVVFTGFMDDVRIARLYAAIDAAIEEFNGSSQ